MSDDTIFEGVDLDNVDYHTQDTPQRTTRKPRSDKGQPRTRGRVSNKQIAEDLLVPVAFIAQGLAVITPTGSAVLLKRSESMTQSLVSLASPKMLAALKKASKIGPGVDLGRGIVEFFIAMMLDLGRIPPEHPLAMVTHVTDIYLELHPELMQSPDNNVYPMNGGFPNQGGFTPFAPVQSGA